MLKSKIVTLRRWDNPAVQTFLDTKTIGASMDLTDFIDALVEEMGNPATLLTKAQLKQKLETASTAVIAELKKSTASIV